MEIRSETLRNLANLGDKDAGEAYRYFKRMEFSPSLRGHRLMIQVTLTGYAVDIVGVKGRREVFPKVAK